MRFHYGAIPESSDFQPEAEGWRAIREPNPAAVQFLAIPVMIVLFLLWCLFVLLFVLPKPIDLHMPTTVNSISSSLWALGLLILLIPLHEFLHALAHPRWGSSSDTIIGLWLPKGLFYAHYDDSMPRNRFLMVFISPYLVLGVLPTILMAIFPELMQSLLLISLLGSILPCGDFVGVGLVLFQIPRSTIVRNKGWKTYWKLDVT